MAVAVAQSIQATTGSATSLLLPSWSIVANNWIGVCVALRDDTVTPTVSGHGLTWVQQLGLIGTDGQNAAYLFRAQASANNTGQITISLPGNGDPVGAAAIRYTGQALGSNGLAAIDATATDRSPLTDNNDMKVDITTIADNDLITAWGTFRLANFTPPAGQTTLQTVNVGSSGDTTHSALWRLNGLKSPAGLQTMGADNDLDSDRDWVALTWALKEAAPAVANSSPPSSLMSILGIG